MEVGLVERFVDEDPVMPEDWTLEDLGLNGDTFFDDVSGAELEPELLKKAVLEELGEGRLAGYVAPQPEDEDELMAAPLPEDTPPPQAVRAEPSSPPPPIMPTVPARPGAAAGAGGRGVRRVWPSVV